MRMWQDLWPEPKTRARLKPDHSKTKEGFTMKYRTIEKIDTYGFWGVVAVIACGLWWFFTRYW